MSESSTHEISKKELLALTGISYGQLYRWKREGLIPEDWFEKRSAYTGQETFFPREHMLERIKTIQSMKDTYSLSEIREHLEGGKGQPDLRCTLLSIPDMNEAFVESLRITRKDATLSGSSLKAVAVLFSALNKVDAREETKRVLISDTIEALSTPAEMPRKATEMPGVSSEPVTTEVPVDSSGTGAAASAMPADDSSSDALSAAANPSAPASSIDTTISSEKG